MSDLYQYHQKYSGSKKIKYSRVEIKVLEKMRRSDFANFQRVLLLLWSRLEFRSRSTLSIHQELDQVKETFVSDMTKNESGAVGSGGVAVIDTPHFRID